MLFQPSDDRIQNRRQGIRLTPSSSRPRLYEALELRYSYLRTRYHICLQGIVKCTSFNYLSYL